MTWKPIDQVTPRPGTLVRDCYYTYRVVRCYGTRVALRGLHWSKKTKTLLFTWATSDCNPIVAYNPLCPKKAL